jgi:hypothetical protein
LAASLPLESLSLIRSASVLVNKSSPILAIASSSSAQRARMIPVGACELVPSKRCPTSCATTCPSRLARFAWPLLFKSSMCSYRHPPPRMNGVPKIVLAHQANATCYLFPMAGAHSVLNSTVLRLVLLYRIQMRMSDLTEEQLFSVPCPTCGVAPGEPCLLHSGAPRSGPHVDRKLSAAEAIEAKRIPRDPRRR